MKHDPHLMRGVIVTGNQSLQNLSSVIIDDSCDISYSIDFISFYDQSSFVANKYFYCNQKISGFSFL